MLLEGADQEEVLDTVATTAREIDGADTVLLVLPGLGGELVVEIAHGLHADELLGLTPPADARSVEVFRTGVGDTAPGQVQPWHPVAEGFGPALYAPLRTGGRSVGVMVLLRRHGASPFTPADVALCQTFAAQAALAFVLAEARAAEDVAALHAERARIARDLHDLAIQQLFAAGMQLENARRDAAAVAVPAEVTGMLAGALDNVDSTVRQIRAIVRALDTTDAPPPVVERLRREVVTVAPMFGFQPRLEITLEGRPLGPAQSEQGDVDRIDAAIGVPRADHVVAVAREGLTNAARHARATAVTVRLDVSGAGGDGAVTVEVEDDGVGLPVVRDRASGTRNLASRAREVGGDFALAAAPSGRGVLLRWSSPLD